MRVLEKGLELANIGAEGPVLDIGCSVGRTTFALAEKFQTPVLGIDLNFSMLRMASEILRTGTVKYPRRRVGLVYDRREFQAKFENTELVDFWACDATSLPFSPQQFATIVTLNTLDCTHSPVEFLSSISSAMKPGASAIMACPYDWSNAATPIESWLGGHSQRTADSGASEPVLRRMLTPGNAQSIVGLKWTAEEEVDWQVRMHDRSTVSYQVHLVAAERLP